MNLLSKSPLHSKLKKLFKKNCRKNDSTNGMQFYLIVLKQWLADPTSILRFGERNEVRINLDRLVLNEIYDVLDVPNGKPICLCMNRMEQLCD